MVSTGAISELPGYLYYYDGSYTPYLLKDENTANMCMDQAVNLVEPKIITQDGEVLLKAGGYLFSDAAEVSDLKQNEKISISKTKRNEVRRINKEAVFQSTIPDNGRIIIFSPNQEVQYDSLFDGKKAVVVSEASYVIFIGNEGDSFKTKN